MGDVRVVFLVGSCQLAGYAHQCVLFTNPHEPTDGFVQCSHIVSQSASPPLLTQRPFQTFGSPPYLTSHGSTQMLKRLLPSLPFYIYLPTTSMSTRNPHFHRQMGARHPVLSQSISRSDGRNCPAPSASPYHRLVLSCSRRAVSPRTLLGPPGLANTESAVVWMTPLQSHCRNPWSWRPRQGPIPDKWWRQGIPTAWSSANSETPGHIRP